jgi:hypothetical protein
MKVKSLKLGMVSKLACLLIVQSFSFSPDLLAKTGNGGVIGGGGGDASETRVSDIRSDILSWIKKDGAKGLTLPSEISYGEYTDKMTDILQPKKVVVSFTDNVVLVNKVEKTCRGFISKVDSKDHILCNIKRYKETSDSEQYKLIHHEFAGLINLEKNEGASSDYKISTQITDFLTQQTVLKLAVKKDWTDDLLADFKKDDADRAASRANPNAYYERKINSCLFDQDLKNEFSDKKQPIDLCACSYIFTQALQRSDLNENELHKLIDLILEKRNINKKESASFINYENTKDNEIQKELSVLVNYGNIKLN